MAEKISTFAQRLQAGMDLRGYKPADLARLTGIDKSSISRYRRGAYKANQDALYKIAQALQVSESWLMGYDTPMDPDAPQGGVVIPAGFQAMPDLTPVPLVGDIACGTPILAEENIKQLVGVPAAWHADFALECHGDSMAPRICDGDIVCIRKQAEVETGQIAAVRIGDEATLKRFYKSGDTVQLVAENPAVCPPMVYSGEQLEDMQIEGLAVGFCRSLI